MDKKIKKIIGFDSWLGGSRHYQRLLPSLEAQSIQLTLVYLGSWGNELVCLPESRVGDLRVRDISFYPDGSFESVLDVEQPDAVILLSIDTFAHRAFLRYCNQRSIPSLYLTHAIETVFGQTGNKEAVPKRSKVAHVKHVFSKISKLFKYTFPVYVKALLKTKAAQKDWRRFISDIFQLAIGGEPSAVRAADDSITSKCAVYMSSEVEHMMSCFGFLKEDVSIVGNPDLREFGLKESMIGRWSHPELNLQKYIMYIETGLYSSGTMYAGNKGFIKHLIETEKSLAAQGYKMRLKLKPSQKNRKFIERGLADTNIELVTNKDFLQAMGECSACLAETTSLALIPALMGMPLLLARYGVLESLSFGSILIDYPRSYPITDISSVSKVMQKNSKKSDSAKLSAWIDLNVGPLPPEEMPERVTVMINDMITG